MGRYGSGERYLNQSRQKRRAQIYERRARQLFLYKLVGFVAVLSVFLLLITVRFFSAPDDDAKVRSQAAANVAGVARTQEPSAQQPVLPTARISSPLSGNIPDIPGYTPLYQPAVKLERSADAASFFEGYTVYTTADTVQIPVSSPVRASADTDAAGNGQGSADSRSDYLDSSQDNPDVFLDSESAILINLDTGEVVASRNANEQIYPASMTKVLTLLVANEQMTDRSGTFTITQDITDFTYANDLSAVCWAVGETVTVEDMEYGTILPSGADASIGLARYSTGSEEAFVTLMNNRIREMGLSEEAQFTNVTGMHEEGQHCTVTDMAMIMKAAVEYKHTLDVMRTGEYRTSHTPEHPDGVYFFNLFLDRTQVAEAEGRLKGNVICAKTGYTSESRNCAVTYYISETGAHYVCVTAKGGGSRRVVEDHINLYNTYAT